MEPIIHIDQVHKYFGHVHALQGVSLDIFKGEVVVVIGPSGSGKSTLLRCINRLEEFDRGKIVVDGIPLDTAENITLVVFATIQPFSPSECSRECNPGSNRGEKTQFFRSQKNWHAIIRKSGYP